MKVVNISQNDQRDLWLQERLGRITGTKVKGIKPLTRGMGKPMGFWRLLAEKVAVPRDGEDPMDRGHRLQVEAMNLTAKKFKLKNLNTDPGLWLSDEDEDIAVSPDGAESNKRPSYAIEVKCLDSAIHLRTVITDMKAKKENNYKPIDSLPNQYYEYREQAIQYFVVNENLKTLYFTLYDDRVISDKYAHYVIVIKREEIEEEIAIQKSIQLETLKEIKKIAKEIIR